MHTYSIQFVLWAHLSSLSLLNYWWEPKSTTTSPGHDSFSLLLVLRDVLSLFSFSESLLRPVLESGKGANQRPKDTQLIGVTLTSCFSWQMHAWCERRAECVLPSRSDVYFSTSCFFSLILYVFSCLLSNLFIICGGLFTFCVCELWVREVYVCECESGWDVSLSWPSLPIPFSTKAARIEAGSLILLTERLHHHHHDDHQWPSLSEIWSLRIRPPSERGEERQVNSDQALRTIE